MGNVAIVTGGGRGIGAATARLLASQGWDVCLSYRVNDAAAKATAAACRDHGGKAIAVPADVSVEDDVVALFERCAVELGRVGALVNNAGIVAPKARVDELDVARLRRLTEVNLIGPFLCAREAVRRMSTARGGSGGVIVNISSAAARLGSPGEYVDYAATKGAVDTMTLGLAHEVAGEGIRVNAVRPGIIDTAIHESGGQPDRLLVLGPTIPMRRAGEPEEVAAAVAWLCSEAASYVTGSIVDVAGGR